MASLGKRLREQRIDRGVDLATIAADTRISVRYLEALEQEDVKGLPGAIFARSFARQYAAYVGIDPNEIEPQVQALFANEDTLALLQSNSQSQIQVAPLPEAVGVERSSGRSPWALIGLVAVVGVCSAIYVGWQQLRDYTPAPAQVAEAPKPAAPAPAAQPQPAPEVAIPAKMEEEAEPESGLQITASEKTWVDIRSDGRKVFSGNLNANETKTFPGVAQAVIKVGNAGGVEIRTGGKSIGPIGPPGQVRTVLLSPDGSQILQKPKTEAKPEGETGI